MTYEPTLRTTAIDLLALLVLPLAAAALLTPAILFFQGARYPALEPGTRLERSSANLSPYRDGDTILVTVIEPSGATRSESLRAGKHPPRVRDLMTVAHRLVPQATVAIVEGRLSVTPGRIVMEDGSENQGRTDWSAAAYDRRKANRRVRKTAHYVMLFAFWLTGAWRLRRRLRGAPGITVFGAAGLRPVRIRLYGRAFALGAATLALFFIIAFAVGKQSVDYEGPARLFAAVGGYLPLALLLALMEDVAFFGFLGTLMGRRWALTATVFALTHFLHPDGDRLYTWPDALLGLEAVSAALSAVSQAWHRPGELLGLWLIGAVLAHLRKDTGTLWVGMGLHGGWYWSRAVGRRIFDNEPSAWDWLAGTGVFYDGVFGWLAIIGTLFMVRRVVVSPWPAGGNPDGLSAEAKP